MGNTGSSSSLFNAGVGTISSANPRFMRVTRQPIHNTSTRHVEVNPPKFVNHSEQSGGVFSKFSNGIEAVFNSVKNTVVDVVGWGESKVNEAIHTAGNAVGTVYSDVKTGGNRAISMIEKAEDKGLNVFGSFSQLPQNAMILGAIIVVVLLINVEKVGRGVNSATGGRGISF